MKIRKRPRQFDWLINGQITCTLESGNLRLVLGTMPAGEHWHVIALETPIKATDFDAVFSNHSHQKIGFFRTMPEALLAAEEYGKAWLVKALPEPACSCGEIEAT